jgi:hypothetical protein
MSPGIRLLRHRGSRKRSWAHLVATALVLALVLVTLVLAMVTVHLFQTCTDCWDYESLRLWRIGSSWQGLLCYCLPNGCKTKIIRQRSL